MPRFTYKAKDKEGKTQKGLVEATNIKQAGDLLHERGFYIIELREMTLGILSFNIRGKIASFNDIVYFTRQLSTMITSGLTLVESLSILQQQLKKASLIRLASQLEEEVRGGKSFASALEKYPNVFPPIYLALVRAGEASGKLDEVLSRLADTLEKSQEFRGKVRGALVYPAIVVTGLVTVSIIVITVVVPRLTSLYKEFGAELPLPTKILIAISNIFIGYWWFLLVLVIISVFLFLRFKDTSLGKHLFAQISISLPIFGPLIKESTLVETTRTLSILIDGGVPILTALELSRDASNNILFKEAFVAASQKVEKGYPLSDAMTENTIFPPILIQMVAVGEQTGKLGETLFKLSRYFETEAENAVRALTTMIEPLIMILLGLGVGFLVIAVLMPIYSLTSKF